MKATRVMILPTIAVALALAGCETMQIRETALSLLQPGSELSAETVGSGLKEALIKGTEDATAKLSKKGGYADNNLLRIPVPQELAGASSTMRKLGLGGMVDTFETKMNAGAEQAAAKAAPVFLSAIRQMSFKDAKGILSGGDTAATDYFRKTISGELTTVYKPIVQEQLASVGAVRAYSDLVARYSALPLVKKPTLNLEDYATGKALDGLFTAVGEEEKRIRKDPAARTTDLLRKVFANPQ